MQLTLTQLDMILKKQGTTLTFDPAAGKWESKLKGRESYDTEYSITPFIQKSIAGVLEESLSAFLEREEKAPEETA